jgi:hypothetical protein
MRYVVSCQRCQFIADANDIRGFGLQLNTHAWNCADGGMEGTS